MLYPGVQRAAATLRWTGSWHTVFITVERDQQAALEASFIDGLEAYLDGYRMAGVDLQIEDGMQVPLLIQMSVCVRPDYVATDVEQALLAVFSSRSSPTGRSGLFNPARLELGQPFYLSPLVAAAQAVRRRGVGAGPDLRAAGPAERRRPAGRRSHPAAA